MTALYTFSLVSKVTLWWFSSLLRSRPSAWLALLILYAISLSREPSTEIMLPRYLKLSTTFSSTSSMKIAGCGATELGARWNSTSVFSRLIDSPNCLEASEKLFSMACRSPGLWAMSAQSSANRASWMRLLRVFVLALSLRRSKMEPS